MGDRRADVDCRDVVAAGDGEPQLLGPALHVDDLADIGDNPGEHPISFSAPYHFNAWPGLTRP